MGDEDEAGLKRLLVTRRARILGSESWLDNRCKCPKGAVCRGKSGLRRAKCQVTPGGREPTESATENKPPKSIL